MKYHARRKLLYLYNCELLRVLKENIRLTGDTNSTWLMCHFVKQMVLSKYFAISDFYNKKLTDY